MLKSLFSFDVEKINGNQMIFIIVKAFTVSIGQRLAKSTAAAARSDRNLMKNIDTNDSKKYYQKVENSII